MWQAWVLLKLNHVNVTWSTGREFLRDTMNIVTSTTFSSFRVSSIVLPSNILILHKSLFFLFHFNKLIFILYPLFFKFLPMNLHVSLKYYFQNSFNVLKFTIKINEDWTKQIILSIENNIIREFRDNNYSAISKISNLNSTQIRNNAAANLSLRSFTDFEVRVFANIQHLAEIHRLLGRQLSISIHGAHA